MRVPVIPWGNGTPSIDAIDSTFAICGMIGSGKTLLLRMMMRAVLVASGALRYRALIYDPKLEFYPLLVGMGIPEASIKVMHPFDRRSHRWDLSHDVVDRSGAQTLANTLINDTGRDHQYFDNGARALLAGVFRALSHRKPGDWSLGEAIHHTSSPAALRDLLSSVDETRSLVEIYLDQPAETSGGLISTLDLRLQPYRVVANLWEHTALENAVRLRSWATDKEPSVLLFASDDHHSNALDPINRAMFQTVATATTGRHTSDPEQRPDDRTWFFLDELRTIGCLDQLDRLLLKGRSKGAHTVLAFQDILGLQTVYHPLNPLEFVGQCGNVALLRIQNHETQEWAANLVGQRYQLQEQSNTTFGERTTHGVSYGYSASPVLIPSFFAGLERPSPETGFPGVFVQGNAVSIHSDSIAHHRLTLPPGPLPRGMRAYFLSVLSRAFPPLPGRKPGRNGLQPPKPLTHPVLHPRHVELFKAPVADVPAFDPRDAADQQPRQRFSAQAQSEVDYDAFDPPSPRAEAG